MHVSLPLQSPEEARAVLGVNDQYARRFRDGFSVTVTVRKGALHLDGEEDAVIAARRVAEEILARYRRNGDLDGKEVAALLDDGAPPPRAPVPPPPPPVGVIVKNRRSRDVIPRSGNQKKYVAAMEKSEVVFGIGPAGTGKTYLAVAMAVRMLRDGVVQKLILTRPAVEAGEKLGFLPGTFEAKVNPYLRPLYDALFDLVEPGQIRKFQENDVIEVAPLAYMRGRTLADAFIILDEAQNTTAAQMKMFLTRMGEGSRMVVTGDVTQIDLPERATSGLIHASRLLAGVDGISICRFESKDIVRHRVVQAIVDAYEREHGA